jgi:proline iminopeptidase
MLIVGPPRYYQRVFPEELRRNFEIVIGNMRAFVSPPQGFDVTTLTRDTYCDDIEAIRQVTELVRPVVVGHSIAGTMALEYARRYSDSVRGVAAIGALPVGTKKQMQRVGEFFEQDADAERRAAHERNFATRRVPTAITTGRDLADLYIANGALYWYDPTFDASPLWDGVDAQAEITNHAYDTLFAEYDLEPLDLPVFVALGRYDYAIPYDLWDEELTQGLSRIHYRLYDKSGHTPPYEEPQRFTADITAWAESL